MYFQICLLHFNELPMKKIFTVIDGPTKGPNLFSGPIGKFLFKAITLPVVDFARIDVDVDYLSDLRSNGDLGSDQKYLRDMILAIYDCEISTSLAGRSPGKIGYARWLTTANAVLRIYVATINPSKNMIVLSKYIIRVYARMWFAIKARPQFYNSPTHMHNMITNAKCINDPRILSVLQAKLNTNSYSLHSENLLCAMLVDPRETVRKKAVERIIKCRETPETTVRKFVCPKVDMEADDYYQLIDENEIWLESILTKNITDELLREYLDECPIIKFDPYPSHTQSVERHIRLVSQTSKSITSPEERDARINAALMHRRLFPKNSTKRDFNPLF